MNTREMKSQSLVVSFKEQIYIKIQRYSIYRDSHFKEVISKNLKFKGEIIQILSQIAKVMKIYSLDLGYVDSNRILDHVSKPYRISKDELLACIVGSKDGNYTSLQNVRGQKEKKRLAIAKVVSCLRFIMERRKS